MHSTNKDMSMYLQAVPVKQDNRTTHPGSFNSNIDHTFLNNSTLDVFNTHHSDNLFHHGKLINQPDLLNNYDFLPLPGHPLEQHDVRSLHYSNIDGDGDGYASETEDSLRERRVYPHEAEVDGDNVNYQFSRTQVPNIQPVSGSTHPIPFMHQAYHQFDPTPSGFIQKQIPAHELNLQTPLNPTSSDENESPTVFSNNTRHLVAENHVLNPSTINVEIPLAVPSSATDISDVEPKSRRGGRPRNSTTANNASANRSLRSSSRLNATRALENDDVEKIDNLPIDQAQAEAILVEARCKSKSSAAASKSRQRISTAVAKANALAAHSAQLDIDEYLGSRNGQRLSKKDRNKLSAMKYRKKRKLLLGELEEKVASLELELRHLDNAVQSVVKQNETMREDLTVYQDRFGVLEGTTDIKTVPVISIPRTEWDNYELDPNGSLNLDDYQDESNLSVASFESSGSLETASVDNVTAEENQILSPKKRDITQAAAYTDVQQQQHIPLNIMPPFYPHHMPHVPHMHPSHGPYGEFNPHMYHPDPNFHQVHMPPGYHAPRQHFHPAPGHHMQQHPPHVPMYYHMHAPIQPLQPSDEEEAKPIINSIEHNNPSNKKIRL